MEEKNVKNESLEYPCHQEAAIWGVLLLSLFFAAAAFLGVTVVWMQNMTLQADVQRTTGVLRGGQTQLLTEGVKRSAQLERGFVQGNDEMETFVYEMGIMSDDESTVLYTGEATISAEWSYNEDFERVCIDSMSDADYKKIPNGLNPLSVYCFEEGEDPFSADEGSDTLRIGSVDMDIAQDSESGSLRHTVELLEVVE